MYERGSSKFVVSDYVQSCVTVNLKILWYFCSFLVIKNKTMEAELEKEIKDLRTLLRTKEAMLSSLKHQKVLSPDPNSIGTLFIPSSTL